VVDDCRGTASVESALADLRSVGAERRSQLDRARSLRVDALPDGGTIQKVLVEALTHSLEADEAFVTWTSNVLDRGCGHDPDYDAGVAASSSAQAAKQRLVGLWNPVATRYALATRTDNDV
jgi:hypothetical protein